MGRAVKGRPRLKLWVTFGERVKFGEGRAELLEAVDRLGSFKKAVEQMNRNESSQSAIAIESPFPLDEDAVARIKRIAGNDLAPHTLVINKNLLAGFKARFRGRLYDGSAERVIKQLLK